MARIGSQEIGGYYKTPRHLIPFISRLINTRLAMTRKQTGYYSTYAFVDPCAGTGEALFELSRCLLGEQKGGPTAELYACELEEGRANSLQRGFVARSDSYYHRHNGLHGDAFCLDWGIRGEAHILYLNPPYDTDREFGRLEYRFLERFTGILRPAEGILIYLVPDYTLEVTAQFIAREYEQVHCFQFPPDDYEAFKQVVLVAVRRKVPARFVDEALVTKITHWAKGGKMPTLGSHLGPVVSLLEGYGGLTKWQLNEMDVQAVYRQSRPWMVGRGEKLRPVRGLGLEIPMQDMMGAVFPVIMPPRPAHVAIALASGLVNGLEVLTDDPASDLPPIMVKGVFVRERKTVEEKKNKDGDITSVIQVEQPLLQVTVLNMHTWTYHDLKKGTEPTGSHDFDAMNIADLLTYYGRSLAKLMNQQCPPLHNKADVAHEIELPPLGLVPFTAQRHAIIAALKVAFTDRYPFAGENPFVLGEVGTGKTLITLAVAECLSHKNFQVIKQRLAAIGIRGGKARPIRRLLVMCPPHLLDSWRNEAKKIIPAARVVVLESVSDVVREGVRCTVISEQSAPGSGLTIYLLSREMGKLGHAWADGRVQGKYCPTCGARHVGEGEAIVRNRQRCEARPLIPQNEWAHMALKLAALAAPVLWNENVDNLLQGRYLGRWNARAAKALQDIESEDRPTYLQAVWERRAAGGVKYLETPIGRMVNVVYGRILAHCQAGELGQTRDLMPWLLWLFTAANHPQRNQVVADCTEAVYQATVGDPGDYGRGADIRQECLKLFCLLDVTAYSRFEGHLARMRNSGLKGSHWGIFEQEQGRLKKEYEGQEHRDHEQFPLRWQGGQLQYRQNWSAYIPVGSLKMVELLLNQLVEDAEFGEGPVCNTPLFQAIPQPRRVPLASYISKYHPNFFDVFVPDEAHEYSHDGSAQERAAHRMTEQKKPVLALTGTSNNGYSSSLFMNMWSLSRRFRGEFGRHEVQAFVTRYGYRKIRIDPEDKDKTVPVNYGEVSDRVNTGTSLKMRQIGEAPGVLPLFILKHLLPVSISIHKADLDHELPPLYEYPLEVEPDKELLSRYLELRGSLFEEIMANLRGGSGDVAAKLWGQVAMIPTYLDRAHSNTGNTGEEGERCYQVRYPESVGGGLIAAAEPFAADVLLAKEKLVMERITAELDEKRPVLLFVWNTRSGLSQRWLRLLTAEIGNHVAVLDADKVSAGKRQAWIDAQVIAKRRWAMIVNPKAVETGLNNLTYFPTAMWLQNPNCSPIIYTQANGRMHRPGQEYDQVRIYMPYYKETSQEAQFTLLGHKVAASKQTDGLDVTSALLAAGAGDGDGIDAMAVGQALYKMLVSGEVKRPVGSVALPPVQKVEKRTEHKRPLVESTAEAKGVQMRLLEHSPVYTA